MANDELNRIYREALRLLAQYSRILSACAFRFAALIVRRFLGSPSAIVAEAASGLFGGLPRLLGPSSA